MRLLARISRTAQRATRAAKAYAGDVLWLVAIGLLAHGLGRYSAPLEPVVWGAALLIAVMYGGPQQPRRVRRR